MAAMRFIDRRKFLSGASSAMGWGLAAPYVLSVGGCDGPEVSGLTFGLRTDSERIFDLSVASGDPSPRGVVLWTHLRPEAVVAGTPLRFQIAQDPAFTTLVVEGTVASAAIGPQRDHTIRVEIEGPLAPGAAYHYRFIYGDTASRTGRCRTLPPAGVASVKLAAITCQDFTNGYYGAFRHIAEDDSIDFLLHLGDFIYESVGDPRFQDQPFADRRIELPSGGTVALGLQDYRALYRKYRSDPALQRALERHTAIICTDDHETANDCYWDYARDTLGAPDHPFAAEPAALKKLKLESQRAWLEYAPARVTVDESATHPHQYSRVYREFALGDLVRLCALDTRTYRTPHPCGEGDIFHRYLPVGCTNLAAPTQSILGADQRTWLVDRLGAGGALWKLLGNQTFFGPLSAVIGGVSPINVDAWDGYGAERRWLTAELRRRGVKNLVLLTGDMHSTIASHVMADYNNLNPFDFGNFLGAEFMTPAVTSAALMEMLVRQVGNDTGLADGLTEAAVRLNNPHVQYFNSSRYGYSTILFTRQSAQWTAYAVDKSTDAGTATRQPLARFRKSIGWPYLIRESTAGL